MHPIFQASRYETPAGYPRQPLDRLFLGTRLGFYLLYLNAVLATSRVARRGELDDQGWVGASFRIFHDIEGCGGRFALEGLENLEQFPGPAVIIANHQSTMETMILPGVIQPVRPVTFVVKDSLLHGPLFGPVMRSRDPIALSRQNPREDLKKVLEEGPRVLAGGRSLIVFPQAHRRDDFDPAGFNSLGVKLALKAGVPVIPAALQTDFWGNGRLLRVLGPIRPHRPIRMVFGAPIRPTGNSREAHQAVIDFITGRLAEWKRSDPPR